MPSTPTSTASPQDQQLLRLVQFVKNMRSSMEANDGSSLANAAQEAFELVDQIDGAKPDAVAPGALRAPPAPDLLTLDLNVFDDEGNVVDATTATLSINQVSDIVDHATQLILMRRSDQPIDGIMDELDEALSAADVIEQPGQEAKSAPRAPGATGGSFSESTPAPAPATAAQVPSQGLPEGALAVNDVERFWDVVVPHFGLDTSFNYDANPAIIKQYLADYERQTFSHQAGEVLGHGLPDWPQDLTTFATRKSYQRGVADARKLLATLSPASPHQAPTAQPRALVVVCGGVADTVCDAGIDAYVFDWDNYNANPHFTGGVPAHFLDLAEPLNIPIDTDDRSPIQYRIDALAGLRGACAGAAFTFATLATQDLAAAELDGGPVNWAQIEDATMAKSIGQDQQDPQKVLAALLQHSPGAITPEQQDGLRARLAALMERYAVNERFISLVFPFMEAWTFVHGSKDQTFVDEYSKLKRECGEFAEHFTPSSDFNERLYAALEKAAPLVHWQSPVKKMVLRAPNNETTSVMPRAEHGNQIESQPR
jgi:hypothetical protein